MQNEQLIVKYVPIHNCFVTLPNKYCGRFGSQVGGIKIINNGSPSYLSHSNSQLNNTSNSLFINATFAQNLKIVEGSHCTVSTLADPPNLTSVTVSAQTQEDLSIVKLQALKIQTILLNQISIVSEGQPLVVWLSKGLYVILIVHSMLPNFKYGKLQAHTEVHVLESIKMPKQSSECIIKYPENALDSTEGQKTHDLLRNCYKKMTKTILRVVPMPESMNNENLLKMEIKSSFYIFLDPSQAKKCLPDMQGRDYCFCKLKILPRIIENINFGRDQTAPNYLKDYTIMVVMLEIENNSEINLKQLRDNVLISKDLQCHLKLDLGAKIMLEPTDIPTETPTALQLLSSDQNLNRDIFEDYIRQFSPKKVLINSGMKLVLNKSICEVIIIPMGCCCALIDLSQLQNLIIEIKNTKMTTIENSNAKKINSQIIQLPYLISIISECLPVLNMGLNSCFNNNIIYDRENIIICGDIGSGKTTLCRILSEKMVEAPNFVYTRTVECRKLKGKKSEAIQKILISLFNDCSYYQPSIIFFDDLESLTNVRTDEENNIDSINSARIADILFNIVKDYQLRHLISIVVTCNHMENLGSQLGKSRILNLFRTVLKIPSLTQKNRIKALQSILQAKMSNNIMENISWEYYGSKTEGWVIQDVVDLAERAVFIAWKRQINYSKVGNCLRIINDDLMTALMTFKPISLRGLELYEGKGYDWVNIGGLEEVKENLVQLLQWPLRYSGLFKNAPVKQQNGVLLFGMPGTGKTMLAGAIAKECGLNFINIKGPELISKYIGASEEAVREIFEKAKRARPCVLFFDEFESLAPR